MGQFENHQVRVAPVVKDHRNNAALAPLDIGGFMSCSSKSRSHVSSAVGTLLCAIIVLICGISRAVHAKVLFETPAQLREFIRHTMPPEAVCTEMADKHLSCWSRSGHVIFSLEEKNKLTAPAFGIQFSIANTAHRYMDDYQASKQAFDTYLQIYAEPLLSSFGLPPQRIQECLTYGEPDRSLSLDLTRNGRKYLFTCFSIYKQDEYTGLGFSILTLY
jgi:hypothetical protein